MILSLVLEDVTHHGSVFGSPSVLSSEECLSDTMIKRFS